MSMVFTEKAFSTDWGKFDCLETPPDPQTSEEKLKNERTRSSCSGGLSTDV